MKKIVLLIALLVSPMVATFGNLSNPSTDLGKEIAKLLEKPGIPLVEEETTATVTFTMNEKGELVILSVDSLNQYVESFVKSRLNYTKVDHGNLKIGQPMKIGLRILKG